LSIEDIILEARETILQCDQARAVGLAERTLAEGYDPVEVISAGFSYGIREMGELFGRGEVFLPQLIMSSEVMKAAVKILDAAIVQSGVAQYKGIFVIATVEGDVHDIGKGIVISLLKTQGIQVHDMGRDVSVVKIIEKALEVKADIIGTSALLTTTLMSQKKLEDELRKNGLREQFKTMVGGAPATQRWADRIGADAYAEDAAEAVTKALLLLKRT